LADAIEPYRGLKATSRPGSPHAIFSLVNPVPNRLVIAMADRYLIERELGQGGMATVYLAQDLKHDRKVALKVLKPELAAVLGADRFVQEIKTTASLQHPHILPLFDSGTADGFLYYVMPFIEGETLRDRLNRETQLGVDEAVRITREVADALDYAHRRGVIHRDIKPENILLHDGRPMVADFGIALAVSAAAGGRMTETGLSLGTPHYMSPEQATADKEISGRSDIYSLASVLYEMLAGQPPHLGGSAQQIIMKIIAEPVDAVTRYRKAAPPNVAAALAKALEKLPADRFATAREFGDALQNLAFVTARSDTMVTAVAAAAARKSRGVAATAVAVAGLATVIGAWGWLRPRPETPLTRLDLSLDGLRVSGNSDVVVSPDGSMIAFSGLLNGQQAIYLRRLDGVPDFLKVPGTDGADGSPTFSPDSRWIAFRRQSDHRLVKIALQGSGTTAIAQGARTIFPFSHWGTPDRIVFHGGTSVGPILARADGGGTPDTLGLSAVYRTSFLLPDGSGLLYTRGDSVFVQNLKTRASSLLVPGGRQPWYVPSGQLLYVTGTGGVAAVAFDLKRHRITGTPMTVLETVASTQLVRGYSVSSNGVLVYRDGPGALASTRHTRFFVVNLEGGADTLRLPPGRRAVPRFSPDGQMIAYEFASGRGLNTDLYTFNLVTGTNTRLTFDGDNDDPVWSPDGRRIAFTKGRSGVANVEDIFIKAVDNSGPEQEVLSLPGNQNPMSWHGDTIGFQSNQAGQYDLHLLSLAGDGKPTPFLQAPWGEFQIQISPDGKAAAFTSAEAGGSDVWIRDFPVPLGKWQVSANQLSSSPRWSRDGTSVYFWRASSVVADTLYRARIERTPGIVVKAPEVVLVMDVDDVENWDLHPDEKRLIVTVADTRRAAGDSGSSASTMSRYVVVQNWFKELQALTRNERH
jgi:Tol biopolymer transport system component/tRNA A-37 threonylcarbamoyl transferase component Bud32